MHPVFPPCSPPLPFFPLPPLSPLLLFFLASGCTRHTPLPPSLLPSSFLLPVWFAQPCCSVCHCLIVILTTHSHNAAFSPSLPLSSSFPLPTRQQAALGCEASPTWRAGVLAASLEADLVTKEHTILSSNTSPVPHVREDTTLQPLCATRRHNHHHCKVHFLTRLPASRTQPVPATTTMGIAAAHFDCPSLFCCSPATNGLVSSTCEAEERDATRHNSTRGCSAGCACLQAYMRVCEPTTWLPHLHLASSTHNSSRD